MSCSLIFDEVVPVCEAPSRDLTVVRDAFISRLREGGRTDCRRPTTHTL